MADGHGVFNFTKLWYSIAMNIPDAEFDNFLTEVTETVEQQEMRQLRTDVAMAACDDALDHYNVPTTYRFDDKRRAALERGLDEDGYFKSVDEGIYALRAAVLIDTWSNGSERDYMTEQKKQLMADIHVGIGAAPNSEWMQFIDGVVAGDPLDFDSVDDIQYLSAAQERADQEAVSAREYSAKMIANVNEVLGENFTEIAFTRYMIIYLDITSATIDNEYQRTALVDELSRKHNVSREYVQKIMAMLDDTSDGVTEQ